MSAATLAHEQTIEGYIGVLPEVVPRELRSRIDGKRITAQRMRALLDAALQEPLDLLASADPSGPVPLPASGSVLAQKLAAGGLSALAMDNARDCWSSALKQQLDWASKLGESKSLARHHHLQALVMNEATVAYESNKETRPMGPPMLSDLAERLRKRRLQAPDDTFRSIDEQLLGRAFMLTEQCKLWWSEVFPIKKGGADGSG